MGQPVIVSACRTPIGRFQGTPRPAVRASQLGALAVAEAIPPRGRRCQDAVDEVLMGNVLQAGLGQNPARQAAIHAGLSPTSAAP
jgi:acetyl-CoA C-acetyltransferase